MWPVIRREVAIAQGDDVPLLFTFVCTNSHKKWTRKRGAPHPAGAIFTDPILSEADNWTWIRI